VIYYRVLFVVVRLNCTKAHHKKRERRMPEVHGYGNPTADIMIVGEAPGKTEEEQGRPFVGSSGYEMNNMLAEAGISRDECFVTNVSRLRPPYNKIENFFMTKTEAKKRGGIEWHGKYPDKPILQGLPALQKEIEAVDPNVIIAYGATSLWALTGLTGKTNKPAPTGIMTWRGSQLETLPEFGSRKVVPCVHPAAILRQWANRHIGIYDLRRVAEAKNTKTWDYPKYDFHIRPSFTDVMLYFDSIQEAFAEGYHVKLACDIETRLRHIACLGLANSARSALCIPFMSTDNPSGYWSTTEESEIVWSLKDILTHPQTILIGQNFDYDIQYMSREWGFAPLPARDTMIYQHTLFPGLQKGLDYLSSVYCEFHQYWKDEGKEWDPKLHDEERLWTYNCKDCVVTYEADEVLQKLIEMYKLEEQVDFQMSLIRPVLRAELRGTLMDNEAKRQAKSDMMEYMFDATAFFEYILPENIYRRKKTPWYDSPTQTAEVLYDVLMLPEQFAQRGKGKKTRTANDDALEALGIIEPLIKPVTDRLRDYRSAKSLMSNFLNAPVEWDNRMRSSINICGTETFRKSSSRDVFGYGGNQQNLTSGSKES
jgi:uracil-DNA glycosylase